MLRLPSLLFFSNYLFAELLRLIHHLLCAAEEWVRVGPRYERAGMRVAGSILVVCVRFTWTRCKSTVNTRTWGNNMRIVFTPLARTGQTGRGFTRHDKRFQSTLSRGAGQVLELSPPKRTIKSTKISAWMHCSVVFLRKEKGWRTWRQQRSSYPLICSQCMIAVLQHLPDSIVTHTCDSASRLYSVTNHHAYTDGPEREKIKKKCAQFFFKFLFFN